MLKTNNGTPDQLLESLGRLSKKAGVLATIVLDRTNGAILTTTGSISPPRASVAINASPAVNTTSITSDEVAGGSGDVRGVDQMALLVWNFVNASAGVVQGLDAEVNATSYGIINVRITWKTRTRSSCYDYERRSTSSLSCQTRNTCLLSFTKRRRHSLEESES